MESIPKPGQRPRLLLNGKLGYPDKAKTKVFMDIPPRARSGLNAGSYNSVHLNPKPSSAGPSHPRPANNSAATSDPLQPLRTMADRVGQEVEQFAERLDHWYTNSSKNAAAKHQATVHVIAKFRDIAERKVNELKDQNKTKDQGELDKSVIQRIKDVAPKDNSSDGGIIFGRSFQEISISNEANASASQSERQDLRYWQAELATWELVGVIFDLRHPAPGTDVQAEKEAKLKNVGGTDRYCPKSEVWERFIIDDDLAREKKVILKWLQQTAKNSESDVDAILAQWAKESGKDINTWTSGWLETKAKIKQAKRMQNIEGPLKPHSIVQSNGSGKPLVTQLDPDAPMRQQAALEKKDVYYEHALWMACFEMLRRGEPWNKIREWLKERNESWRAVSIGVSSDTSSEGMSNMSSTDCGYLFRRTAHLAAQGAVYPYEGAVYAIQSGNFQKIQAVSRSWDDHLFAYYNALLLSRFDKFLLAEPKDRPRAQKMACFNFPDVMQHLNDDWENATRKVVSLLMQDKATSQQARTPIKLIQSALLTGTIDELVQKVGIAIADWSYSNSSGPNLIIDPDHSVEKANATGAEGVFSKRGERSASAEEYYQAFMHDPHALRILTHLFIILEDSRNPLIKEQAPKLWARGNVIAAYIESLRFNKRLQLIPLYAVQMEPWRASLTVARILPNVNGRGDHKQYANLMRRYDIDVPDTVSHYFESILAQKGLVSGSGPVKPILKFSLFEEPRNPTEHAFLWPLGRSIRESPRMVIASETPQTEDALVEISSWIEQIEDEDDFFRQLGRSLTVFLCTGLMRAAQKLVLDLSIEKVSYYLTRVYCGYSFDFTQPGAEVQDEVTMRERVRNSELDPVEPSKPFSPEDHAKAVNRLREDSQPYFDLTRIVRIIMLFRQWRTAERRLIELGPAPNRTAALKEIFEDIDQTFAMILQPYYEPRDGKDMWHIYKVYIPEIVFGYLAVAQAGAFLLHKDLIIKAMNVSIYVADDERMWLQLVFKETKRMQELVDRIADVSQTMVELSEQEDSKSKGKLTKKRESRGETLRIWDPNRTD